MTIRPIIVVEDDPFPRMLKAFLDPSIEPQRLAALADFFAHDLPDFAGWLAHLRAMAGPLYPAEVRLVKDQAALRAQLPDATVVVTESFDIGADEIRLAPKLKVVQKYGAILRGIDVPACATRGIRVLSLRRRANISCAEHALMLMLALSKKLHRLHGKISITIAGRRLPTQDLRHRLHAQLRLAARAGHEYSLRHHARHHRFR